jgi:hypothetical protein
LAEGKRVLINDPTRLDEVRLHVWRQISQPGGAAGHLNCLDSGACMVSHLMSSDALVRYELDDLSCGPLLDPIDQACIAPG